jgi:hypothetical protein
MTSAPTASGDMAEGFATHHVALRILVAGLGPAHRWRA